MTTKPDWSDQDTQEAVKLWKEGLTAGQISQALDHRYSRNAVLGKMNRMGLMRNPSQNAPKPKAGRYKPIPHEVAILAKHEAGMRPSDIANAMRLSTAYVREMMDKLGIDQEENVSDRYNMHPMWSLPEDDGRLGFYEKFRRGWAEVQARLSEGTTHA